MADISVDTELLNELGKSILDSGNDYLSQTKNVYSQMASIGESWKDDSATEYINNAVNLKKDIEDLGKTIVNIGNHLTGSSNDYSNNIEDLKAEARIFNKF